MVVQLPDSGKAGSAFPQLDRKEPRMGDSLFAYIQRAAQVDQPDC